ncbi:hypothetical protein KSS87_023528, partial [Heliosperma pusillum]
IYSLPYCPTLIKPQISQIGTQSATRLNQTFTIVHVVQFHHRQPFLPSEPAFVFNLKML